MSDPFPQLTDAINGSHAARLARHMEGFKPTNPDVEAQTITERVNFMIESLPPERREAFRARLAAKWSAEL